MYLFTRCGTPGFVAPEVINIKDMKAKYSSICDIFSLGLIFHYLLFGKSIFKAKSYNDLVKENR
jgi:serine/threonine protein kinase